MQLPQLAEWLAAIGNVKLSRVTAADAIERARNTIAAAKTPYSRAAPGPIKFQRSPAIDQSLLLRGLAAPFRQAREVRGWTEREPGNPRQEIPSEPQGRVRFLARRRT